MDTKAFNISERLSLAIMRLMLSEETTLIVRNNETVDSTKLCQWRMD